MSQARVKVESVAGVGWTVMRPPAGSCAARAARVWVTSSWGSKTSVTGGGWGQASMFVSRGLAGGEFAVGPAQQFLVHLLAAALFHPGDEVMGDLRPGAEVPVRGFLVADRDQFGLSVGPYRVEGGDDGEDLVQGHAADLLPGVHAGL